MKKILSLFQSLMIVSILIFSVNSVSAQVVNTEDFEGTTFPPIGWTLNTSVGGQGQFTTAIWVHRNVGSFPNNATAHSGVWMSRYSSHFTADPSSQSLITPVIDYSGIIANDTAYFSFWVYRDNTSAAGDSVTAYVNTIADVTGATRLGAVAQSISINLPDTVPTIGWYQYTFDVPNSFNTATNYLMLQGTGHTGNNIFTDDFEWTSYPPQCSGTPTIGTVTANPLLICGGSGTSTFTLSGQTSGASGITTVWQSSPNLTGPWTDVSNNATTYTSGTLTATTYFRYYISCSNSASADTSTVITINVSPDPLPVLTVAPTNAAYCNGGSAVIMTVSGATTYTWSPSTGLDNTTGDLVFASPTTPTTYTVIGMDASGCQASGTAAITIANSPIVNPTSSTDTTCTGSSVNLNAGGGGGGGGGNQYSWNPGGVTGNNVTVNPTTTTTYTLTATNNQGCTTTDSSIVIVVTQDVSANFGYTMNGNTILFHDSSFNASSWTWNFGDGNGSTNQNPFYTYSGTGVYTVTLIVTSAGCPGGDTIQIQLSVFPNGMNDLNNRNKLLAYPNPATENILNLNFEIKNPNAELRIVNALGQEVYKNDYSSKLKSHIVETIDIQKFAFGVYEISLKDGGVISNLRFVKQ